jgi:hypothetical protein
MRLFTRKFVKDLATITLFGLLFYILTHNPLTHPKLPETYGMWSIQLMQQPILFGIAGHNYLVLRDANNLIQKELHGLATDITAGTWKYIGSESTDKLQVWEFNGPHFYVDQKSYPGVLLTTGTEAYIRATWDRAIPCKDAINRKNLNYPPYGVAVSGDTENSNSVSYTLMLCMGLDADHLGLLTPGWGKNLLGSQ